MPRSANRAISGPPMWRPGHCEVPRPRMPAWKTRTPARSPSSPPAMARQPQPAGHSAIAAACRLWRLLRGSVARHVAPAPRGHRVGPSAPAHPAARPGADDPFRFSFRGRDRSRHHRDAPCHGRLACATGSHRGTIEIGMAINWDSNTVLTCGQWQISPCRTSLGAGEICAAAAWRNSGRDGCNHGAADRRAGGFATIAALRAGASCRMLARQCRRRPRWHRCAAPAACYPASLPAILPGNLPGTLP